MCLVCFAGIQSFRYRHNIPRTEAFSSHREWYRYLTAKQVNLQFQGVRVLLCLHRVPNAPFDKSALKLAEIQVFERCLKYGTSPDYTRKKKAEEPEMILNIKLAA